MGGYRSGHYRRGGVLDIFEGELERREQYGRKIIKYVLGEKALD